jgi:O-antigen/teichoic acid export membrane protein
MYELLTKFRKEFRNTLLKSKLFKNAFIYTLSEILNKIVPFALLPILTMYLTPSDYGVVATYGAFIGILGVFMHLSIPGSVAINYFKISKEELKIYITNALFILSVTTSLAFLFIYLFHLDLIERLHIPYEWLIIGVISTSAQFITSLNLVLWQAEQNPKSFALYQIVQMLLNNTLVLIFVIGFSMGWQGQLVGQTMAVVIFSFVSFIFVYRRGYLSFKIKKEHISDALRFGIPLIPHTLSGWFKTGVDRIFLTSFLGVATTGLYAVGYQFGMIIGIIALAFNNAYAPYLFEKLSNITHREKKKLVALTYMYFLAILLIAAVLSYISPWLIINYLDVKYSESAQFVPWISFGYAFQGMYYMVVNYIFYLKKTHKLVSITFFSGFLHIVLSYFLIKENGPIGAAQATTISFFVTFILVWILSSKLYSMPWSLKRVKIK